MQCEWITQGTKKQCDETATVTLDGCNLCPNHAKERAEEFREELIKNYDLRIASIVLDYRERLASIYVQRAQDFDHLNNLLKENTEPNKAEEVTAVNYKYCKRRETKLV